MNQRSDIGGLLLRHANRAPRLTAEEERCYITSYRDGDSAALGQLVISNVRLAISRAHQLRGYGLAADDLVQEGIVGLLEAAARFDVGRELRFSTYAGWWIKATTNEFVLRNWSIVRTVASSEQKRLFFGLRGMKARLLRDASVDLATVHAAIATAMGVPLRDVLVMDARLSGGDQSLNAPASWDEDGEAEIGDSLADDRPLPDESAFGLIEGDSRERALQQALANLDDQERLVLQERWLTEDIAPLEALGEFFGITAARVKRIEIKAIEKLQMNLVVYGLATCQRERYDLAHAQPLSF